MDPDSPSARADQIAPSHSVDEIAARWIAQRDTGLTQAERRQLCAWLAASPNHAAAFAAADKSGTELDWPLHLGAVDEVMAGLESRARMRKRRRMVATAGVVAGLMLVGTVLTQIRIPASTPAPRSSALVVKTPEREVLPDGSTVELKDGARIAAQFSEQIRRVTLLKGTAHFKVTQNSRPFVVTASGVTAEALGTEFSVEIEGPNVSVLVTEGRVAINREPEPSSRDAVSAVRSEPLAVLDAGKAVNVSRSTPAAPHSLPILEVAAKEMESRLAWRIPRLEFSGTPLVDVVAMINRHNVQQVVIAERSLETVALSGIVRADKVDALVDLLESEFGVKCVRDEGRIVLHSAR